MNKAAPAFELYIYHEEALFRELRKSYNNNGESLWHSIYRYTVHNVSIAHLKWPIDQIKLLHFKHLLQLFQLSVEEKL